MLPAFFSMPSGGEWIIVLIVALLLFGRRLPEVMRGLGSSVREFRGGMEGKEADKSEERPALPPAPPRDPASPKPTDTPSPS